MLLIPLWKLAPGFCKYICPAGTFEAGLPLVFKNPFLRELTGRLFTWKVFLLVVIVSGSVFCFRAFCRFLCPLGAVYSFFQPVQLYGIRVDPDRCVQCDACVKACPMDIKKVRDRECIHCGKCIPSCPAGAIHYGIKASAGPAPETIENTSGGTLSETSRSDRNTRKVILVLRLVLLALALTLFIAGLLGGGFEDVLGKAIRICHECIGIG